MRNKKSGAGTLPFFSFYFENICFAPRFVNKVLIKFYFSVNFLYKTFIPFSQKALCKYYTKTIFIFVQKVETKKILKNA